MKNTLLDEKIAKYERLTHFFSKNKAVAFERVIKNRTRYITVVMENIFQPQNASAVLRTCDLTGIQDVHIIENYNTYEVNPQVAMGASKWLNLRKYNSTSFNTLHAYDALRQNGYRIVATTPHSNGVSLENLDLEKGKMALVFGTELEGLTETAIEHADEYVTIPMYGFTESYNISVSAALIVRELTEKLRSSEIDWQLPEDEKYEILTEWALKVINRKRQHLCNDFAKRIDEQSKN